MKKTSYLPVIVFGLLSVLVFSSCKKQQEPTPIDKEIRLPMGYASSHSPSSTTPFINTSDLILFNKNNYPGIDSIILIVNEPIMINSALFQPATGGNGIFELYDLTNKKVIENSKVIISPEKKIYISKNIFKNLPNQTIDLGVSVYTSSDTIAVAASKISLFLYRK